jgi:hypothetical protein
VLGLCNLGARKEQCLSSESLSSSSRAGKERRPSKSLADVDWTLAAGNDRRSSSISISCKSAVGND